jgi:outer membrane immunogenic protein
MKKLLLSTVGLVALSGSAMAADLPVQHYKAPPAPVIAPIYDWSGFYIGANGGWGESRNCLDATSLAGLDVSDGCVSRSGGLVGGQFGYRWQSAQFVFGVEAQGDWANLSGSHVSLVNPLFSTGV